MVGFLRVFYRLSAALAFALELGELERGEGGDSQADKLANSGIGEPG